ncbi:MAG: hypothetical protein P4L79_07740, partial [Legionella sp.]|uniref:major capsid protein V20 domain-containing protein n=1 Tax=Legionella sp. TaxID=459 RepID=UPI00284260BF|nr:hypothetical protein [Legionella sp.]
CVFSRDFTTCAFPFHELMTSASLEINNTKMDINYQQYKNLLLRLTSTQANMKLRGAPSALDTTVTYNDSYLARSSPLSGYNDADILSGFMGNGCFNNWEWVNSDGSAAATGGVGMTGSGTLVGGGAGPGALVWSANSSIGWYFPNFDIVPGTYWSMYLKISYREPCLLPLTIFDDCREFVQEALHNVQELQLTYTVNAGNNRVLRNCSSNNIVLRNCQLVQSLNAGGPFLTPIMEITRLTPPLNSAGYSIPKVSLIPTCKFEMLTGSSVGTLAPNDSSVLMTNSVSINGIPDFMIIFARPQNYNNIAYGPSAAGASAFGPLNEADWYCPISNLNVEFEGVDSLMNTFSYNDLYDLSVRNGLCMDYLTATGSAMRIVPSVTAGGAIISTPVQVGLVGSPVVIRPVMDWGSSGLPIASGLGGSFTLKVQATVNNYSSITANNVYLYCACIYGGYFVTDGPNSSQYFKSVLTLPMINTADTYQPQVSKDELMRFTGAGTLERMTHTMARPRSIHHHGHRAHSEPAHHKEASAKRRLA